MGARPSVGTYGAVCDTSRDDYIECVQCLRRFVGGTFDSRLQRWATHAQACGCSSAKARRDREQERIVLP